MPSPQAAEGHHCPIAMRSVSRFELPGICSANIVTGCLVAKQKARSCFIYLFPERIVLQHRQNSLLMLMPLHMVRDEYFSALAGRSQVIPRALIIKTVWDSFFPPSKGRRGCHLLGLTPTYIHYACMVIK